MDTKKSINNPKEGKKERKGIMQQMGQVESKQQDGKIKPMITMGLKRTKYSNYLANIDGLDFKK